MAGRFLFWEGLCIYPCFSELCDVRVCSCASGRAYSAGIGSGGGIVTISTALIKDCFSGEKLTRILSITQALNVIAPMAAPVIGSMLLLYTSWWGAFVLLAFLGSINIIIALLLMEPLLPENDIPGTVVQSMGLLYQIHSDMHLWLILIMFSSRRLHISIYGLCQCISSCIHEYISTVSRLDMDFFISFNSMPEVIWVPLSAYCRQGFQSPYHQCLFPCYCNQWCSTSYYWPIQCSVFHAELSAVHDYRIHSESLYHGCAS